MDALQNTYLFNAIPPGAIVDNAAFTSNVIDTVGYDRALILVTLGALDIAVAALKVQEADAKSSATALTSGADVTGLVFGTSNTIAGSASTLPAATDDNKVYAFEIDLRNRKRYLQVALTGGDGAAGSYASAVAILSKGETIPVTASDRGCGQILRA